MCEEVHLNLANRWFAGSFSTVRSRTHLLQEQAFRFRDCDPLRKLFETGVRRCMAEGLVDGAAFAVDASLGRAPRRRERWSGKHPVKQRELLLLDKPEFLGGMSAQLGDVRLTAQKIATKKTT